MNARQRRRVRRAAERRHQKAREWLLTPGAPVRLITEAELRDVMRRAGFAMAQIAASTAAQVRAALASPRRYL